MTEPAWSVLRYRSSLALVNFQARGKQGGHVMRQAGLVTQRSLDDAEGEWMTAKHHVAHCGERVVEDEGNNEAGVGKQQ